MGATTTTPLTDTTHLAASTYSAVLESRITTPAVVLATATFDVKPVPLQLVVAASGPPRVLIWATCGNSGGDDARPASISVNDDGGCTPAAPPFLTSTLNTAGIPWTLVGDQTSFLAAMQTCAYSAAIIDQPPSAEPTIANDFLPLIHGGFGLFFIHSATDAEPKLAPALGVSFKGKLTATSTVVQLSATPFTTAGQITFNGNSVTLDLQGAQAAGKIMSTQAPALTYNTYGSGRVVVLPFDVEKTTSTDAAKLLVSIVKYVSRAPSSDARSVVPLQFTITTATGGPGNYTVALTIPKGVTVVAASPKLTSSSPASWTATVAGGTTATFDLWVRLPDAIGNVTITAAAGLQGQLPLVTKSVTLSVAADRAAIESALAADLTALSSHASSKDQKTIADATSELNAERSANPATSDGVAAAISHVDEILADLNSLSSDTTTAHKDADRLLLYWYSLAAAATDDEHGD